MIKRLLKEDKEMFSSDKIVAILICTLFTVITIIWIPGNGISYQGSTKGGVSTTLEAVESGFCSTPPTIDGKNEPGEWTEAKIITTEMNYYNVGHNLVETHPAKIYVMNNQDNLFIGLTLEQEEYDGKWSDYPNEISIDAFIILFDTNDDGVFGQGEDKKFLSLVEEKSVYSDQHKLSEEEEKQGNLLNIQRKRDF